MVKTVCRLPNPDGMTIFAGSYCPKMVLGFSACGHPVVATVATSSDTVMVKERRHPACRAVAGRAVAATWHMCAGLARGFAAIMARGAGRRCRCVVKARDLPRRNRMTGLAFVAALDVLR
jgi:hypothetical protein